MSELLAVNVFGDWLKQDIPPPLRVFPAWEAWRAARKTTCQIAATSEDLTFKMSYRKPLLMPGEVENRQRRSTADPIGEIFLFQSISCALCSHMFWAHSKFGVSVWLQTTNIYALIY